MTGLQFVVPAVTCLSLLFAAFQGVEGVQEGARAKMEKVTWEDDGLIMTARNCCFNKKSDPHLAPMKADDLNTCTKLCLGRPDCSHFEWKEGVNNECKLGGGFKVDKRDTGKGSRTCGIVNIRTVADLGNHLFGHTWWRAGCKFPEHENTYRSQFPTEFVQCLDICREDGQCGRITWAGGECSLFYPPSDGSNGTDALEATKWKGKYPTYCAVVPPHAGPPPVEPNGDEGNDDGDADEEIEY